MNKKAAYNLTWIFIGLAIFLTVMTISYTVYDTFMTDNSQLIQTDYKGYYGNMTEHYSETSALGYEASETSLIKKIYSVAQGVVSTFVMGLSAIGKFLEMIPLLGKVINTIGEAIPGFSGILGLLILIATVLIASKYIQAARGTAQEA